MMYHYYVLVRMEGRDITTRGYTRKSDGEAVESAREFSKWWDGVVELIKYIDGEWMKVSME